MDSLPINGIAVYVPDAIKNKPAYLTLFGRAGAN